MKKTQLSAALSLLLLSSTTAAAQYDTLFVQQARLEQSISLRTPFIADTLNLKGEAFNPEEILQRNASLVQRKPQAQASTISAHSAFAPNALHHISFTVDADKYSKFWLYAPKVQKYQAYVNGQAVSPYDEIKVKMGRNKIDYLVYTPTAATDTFDISLIGQQLNALHINSTESRLYNLDDMTFGEKYYSTTLSPSGRYVTTVYMNVGNNFEVNYRTVVTDLHTQRTIMSRDSWFELNWLPNKDLCYFTRKHTNGSNQLFSFDPATLRETLIAENVPQENFRIDPKGNFLVFNVSEDLPQTVATGFKQILHPDDRMKNWRQRNSLFFFDLRTGATQRLTQNKESMHLQDIRQDGQKLLVARFEVQANRQPLSAMDLFEIDTQTWAVDTIFQQEPWITEAQYSPNGKQLLVKGTPAAFKGIGSEVKVGQQPQGFDYRLFRYDLHTQTAAPLLKDFAPSVQEARWHTADNMIYLHCTEGDGSSIWRLNPQTGERLRFNLPLTTIVGYDIANSPRPRIVFFGQTDTSARNAYLARLDKATPSCDAFGEVSFRNAVGQVRLPSCKEWSFTSAKGDQIKGFYFLPANFDASKKYPMVVYYYGGVMPTSRILEYPYPLSVMANMGYVVLCLNPSGTVGYGQEFAARHSNAWGEGTADEIIEGTQTFCRQNPYVDASKVGCIGASYGGFMTQYLQTRTDIFAAAISHAGISNIASYWGGGNWGYSYSETAAYGSFPWNKPELYTRQSPLFNADKIHTPLLLLHGESDTNVPPTESEQLYTALRILGREVALVTMSGEDHIVANPHNRRQWQYTIMAWFAKYLQGDDTWWKDLGYQ